MDPQREYPINPLTEIFPDMSQKEVDNLAHNIAEKGLTKRISIWEDTIIDGRH